MTEREKFMSSTGGDCGVFVAESGVSAFSDCCGCGGYFSDETALELTRALMKHFGIKEG